MLNELPIAKVKNTRTPNYSAIQRYSSIIYKGEGLLHVFPSSINLQVWEKIVEESLSKAMPRGCDTE